MTRTIIVQATITVEGDPEPEVQVMRRIRWDDTKMTLEDAIHLAAERMCHEARIIKPEWRVV